MKKLLSLVLLLLITVAHNSCRNKEVEKEPEKFLTYEELNSVISGYPLYVSKAYKIVGKDSLNVLADTIMQIYQNAAFLTFAEGNVLFYGGSRIANDQFKESARTFSLNTRISLPTNLSYHWDETKKTIVVESKGTSSYLPIIPSGKSAYLDQSKFDLAADFEKAKNAAIPPSMTFVYEDYIIEMKPMFVYKVIPDFTYFQYLVVF